MTYSRQRQQDLDNAATAAARAANAGPAADSSVTQDDLDRAAAEAATLADNYRLEGGDAPASSSSSSAPAEGEDAALEGPGDAPKTITLHAGSTVRVQHKLADVDLIPASGELVWNGPRTVLNPGDTIRWDR